MSRRKEIDIPVTMMTTKYFLTEIAVFRTIELWPPPRCLDMGGQLENNLDLVSLCMGHGGSK